MLDRKRFENQNRFLLLYGVGFALDFWVNLNLLLLFIVDEEGWEVLIVDR